MGIIKTFRNFEQTKINIVFSGVSWSCIASVIKFVQALIFTLHQCGSLKHDGNRKRATSAGVCYDLGFVAIVTRWKCLVFSHHLLVTCNYNDDNAQFGLSNKLTDQSIRIRSFWRLSWIMLWMYNNRFSLFSYIGGTQNCNKHAPQNNAPRNSFNRTENYCDCKGRIVFTVQLLHCTIVEVHLKRSSRL